jgi:RHH-type transcriptional regulator, rel operon repressor / antitoxin RelB
MMLGIRLPENLSYRLTSLSKNTHRSKTHYVIEALQDYLDIHEETLNTIAKYERERRNGTLKTLSLEEAMKELEIDQKDLDVADLD